MGQNELLNKLRSGKITRRELHRGLAAAGVGLVTVPFFAKPGKAADHPMVFVWGGYEDPGLHPAYIDEHGESPGFSLFGDEEEAFAKMRAGFHPDATMFCSYKVPQWYDAGILQPIDVSRLSNWPDLIPVLKDIPVAFQGGERVWVCNDWGQTSVLYRTDLVDIEEESWGLLWDERYAGRLAMIDSLIDGVMVAAIYGGAENPFDMTPDEVAMTKELLKKQLPLLRYYSNSMTDMENSLASGELVAAAVWNEAYAALVDQGIPVKFMNPKEGLMTWTCGIGIMSWAENIDGAYDWIDAMLGPRAGVYEMTEFGYGHANQKAFEMIDPGILDTRGLPRDPEAFIKSGIFQLPIENEPELQAMFEEVKAGF